MEFEQAIEAANAAMFACFNRYLNDVEVLLLKGAWHNFTYEQIAETAGYSASYLSRKVGPQVWQRLSQALGEPVSKNNFKAAIERRGRQTEREKEEGFGEDREEGEGNASLPVPSTHLPLHSSTPISPTHVDWGEAVDVSLFYGRTHELQTLSQWVSTERCRLIAILGMGGIGKTSLAIKLTQQIEPQFDYVIWRSLRNAPPLETLLNELVAFLSKQTDTQAEIGRLLHWLRTHRCLVILDNLETILQPGDRAGQYRLGYGDYCNLFESIGQTLHQSCLILTSREKPAEVAAMEGSDLPVRVLQLRGSSETGCTLLQAKGLMGSELQQQILCDRYGGNPLALKIIGSTIQELFDGDIQQFLEQDAIVFNNVRRLLEQQVERLSELEQAVMIWLTINREWTSIAELTEDIIPSVSKTGLLETLESLCWRGLIEKRSGRYTQQPVVMEYVSDRFIEQITTELSSTVLNLFLHYALIKTTVKDYVRESQMRVILQPIAEQFCNAFSSQAALEQQVLRILMSLRRSEVKLSGYGVGNLINLCNYLQLDLTGFDFSGLTSTTPLSSFKAF